MRVEVIIVLLGVVALAAGQSGQCCKVHGDPHILTFDSYAYDYMGSGTFILAQDSNKEISDWIVYGTFKTCGDKTKQLSCIVSISVIYGTHNVQFLRMFRVNYQGNEFMVKAGQSKQIGEMRIENIKFKYKISLGSSGITVWWDGITVAQICAAQKCGGGVEGICGNADCDKSNEFNRRGSLSRSGSWRASSSSEFANSWVVAGKADKLEPESGNLPVSRTKPCSVVSASQRIAFEGRCDLVLELAQFSSCVSSASFDAELFRMHCMFDSCAGLVMGAGCPGNKDGNCKAELEAKVYEAIAGGMSDAEARAAYMPTPLDPACISGMALAEDCRGQGYSVSRTWVQSVGCPDDDALSTMRVCP